jgi:hypothetical protein
MTKLRLINGRLHVLGAEGGDTQRWDGVRNDGHGNRLLDELQQPEDWLELGKAMGTQVRKRGELRAVLEKIETIDYRGNEHISAGMARRALEKDSAE